MNDTEVVTLLKIMLVLFLLLAVVCLIFIIGGIIILTIEGIKAWIEDWFL